MGSVNVKLIRAMDGKPDLYRRLLWQRRHLRDRPKDNNNYLTGVTVAVLGNTALLARTGYTFTGWDTVISETGPTSRGRDV